MKHILMTAIATSLLIAAQGAFAYPQESGSASRRDVTLGEVSATPTTGMVKMVDTSAHDDNRAATEVGQDMVNLYIFEPGQPTDARPNSFGGRR